MPLDEWIPIYFIRRLPSSFNKLIDWRCFANVVKPNPWLLFWTAPIESFRIKRIAIRHIKICTAEKLPNNERPLLDMHTGVCGRHEAWPIRHGLPRLHRR